jgi:hypothetical protein
MAVVVHHLGGVIPTRSCMRCRGGTPNKIESRLGIATYMTCQLKWSCIDHVSELGEVEQIG